MQINAVRPVFLDALLPLLSCAGERVETPADVGLRAEPIIDSKCGGGLAFVTMGIANRGATPVLARPQCVSNTPGIEVVENPAFARTLAPGETGQFVCAVRDIGDPPDGRFEGALARLVVRYNGQERSLPLPVTCPR
ncbi:MAG: hypothetical protein EXQ88_06195 [Alphaproteobacteria bacterium]|nr:hypothetical protein [Alphaproteobacteria bacterium]